MTNSWVAWGDPHINHWWWRLASTNTGHRPVVNHVLALDRHATLINSSFSTKCLMSHKTNTLIYIIRCLTNAQNSLHQPCCFPLSGLFTSYPFHKVQKIIPDQLTPVSRCCRNAARSHTPVRIVQQQNNRWWRHLLWNTFLDAKNL